MAQIDLDRYYEDFRQTVRRFMERECAPHRDEWQKAGRTPRDLWLRAGEAGLLCTKVSPDFGGGGGDLYHALIILEEQTRICFNELTFYLHSDIIAPYIELYGTDEQKQRYLPRMATGEMVAAIAMTEPGAGSDLAAIRTTAREDGKGYLLNGQKVFISNGQVANLIVVAAKTDSEAGAKGISLFLMETDGAEGFTRGKTLNKIGCKAQDSLELFFDNVRLAPDSLLGGDEGQGFAQLMRRLPGRAADHGHVGGGQYRGGAGRDGALCRTAPGVRSDAVRLPEHPLQAGRVQDQGDARPRLP